jgi:hypothetical protein
MDEPGKKCGMGGVMGVDVTNTFRLHLHRCLGGLGEKG